MFETIINAGKALYSIYLNAAKNYNYKYEDDQLYRAVSFNSTEFEKNMAVIHFSWTSDLATLTKYFSQQIPPNTANSTWGVGKDGTVHRYLPSPKNPSWTSNATYNGNVLYASYVDPNGVWQTGKYVNNYSCAFEIANINYETYTEKQYTEVAKRLVWMNNFFPDFRLWRVTGHEQLTPISKDDPGKKWDWEKMFKLCGVRKDFYDTYLSYLVKTSNMNTVGDSSRSGMKTAIVKEAVSKIAADLSGKPKNFCF